MSTFKSEQACWLYNSHLTQRNRNIRERQHSHYFRQYDCGGSTFERINWKTISSDKEVFLFKNLTYKFAAFYRLVSDN